LCCWEDTSAAAQMWFYWINLLDVAITVGDDALIKPFRWKVVHDESFLVQRTQADSVLMQRI
jgi:hypothetical protein